MEGMVRRMPWSRGNAAEAEALLTREWRLTNGLGGYASGTIGSVLTRRYHGLLIAALPVPWGRTVMLSQLCERLWFPDGSVLQFSGEECAENHLEMPALDHLTEFRLEYGLPVWRYEIRGIVLETRIVLLHMQNTIHVTYRLASGAGPVRLELRPSLHFRAHNAPVSAPLRKPYAITVAGERYEISASGDLPPLHLLLCSANGAFTLDGGTVRKLFYRTEARQGYEAYGALWSPGYFSADLGPGQDATLIASTEPWTTILALQVGEAYAAECWRRQRLLAAAYPEARSGTAAELVLAADQFIITPAGRVADAARAHAAGDEERSIIAGYH